MALPQTHGCGILVEGRGGRVREGEGKNIGQCLRRVRPLFLNFSIRHWYQLLHHVLDLSKPHTGTTNKRFTPWHAIWRAIEGTTRDSVRKDAWRCGSDEIVRAMPRQKFWNVQKISKVSRLVTT